jgi:hypothetical protein
MDVNFRSFGSCRHSAVTTGSSLRKREQDEIDYVRGGRYKHDYFSLHTSHTWLPNCCYVILTPEDL